MKIINFRKNLKFVMLMIILGLTLACCTSKTNSKTECEGLVHTNIDWSDFLARHDLIWTKAPKAWHDGPFLGNGMLGSLLYQLDDNTFRISLGRADVEDHQTGGTPFIAQSRLPNGYFVLTTQGKITGFEGRLDLYNAETRIKITTEKGAIDLLGLVHSRDMIIYYEFSPSGDEDAKLEFVPLNAIAPARLQADLSVAEHGEKAPSSRKQWAEASYEYNPEPELTKIEGYNISKQTLVAGGETGTAWMIKNGQKGKKQLYVSIEHSFPEAKAVKNAIVHLKTVENESIQSFVKRHRTWWHKYYPESFVSIDDTRMESFYWIQVYKFASGARKGRAFMDTMGPWIVENTAWANGWFNLNTQLSYWFLSTANRLEVAESLFSKIDEKLSVLVSNMPESYGDSCAGMSTIVPQTFISKFPKGRLGFTGELLWTCHDYWLMLERTMDADRIIEKYFPLLKKSVNTYLHFCMEGEDGKIHIPHTRSPEYGGGEDCNFNLSLFRWGLNTLIYIDKKYHINDPLFVKWNDVRARLVDYPTNENGFMVAKNFPFDKSHRHYSHLLMIYPLCEVNIDQPENVELINKSVNHWINYPGTGNAGYSWSGAAAMYALQGDGEKAGKYLDIFMHMQELYPDNPAEIHPTTMYTETNRVQPVTETPFSLCDAMQQMILQSWGGTIRVFPAIPQTWGNVAFDGLLAAGGFEVSASRKNGLTKFIRIKSNAGEQCMLKTDMVVERIEGVKSSAVKTLQNGRIKIDLKKGEEIVLYAEGVDVAEVEPVKANPDACNSFGLN
jgi:hypothetical protein